MGFFNKMQKLAMITGHYICSECGKSMEFEDEWKDTLVCPHCGHSEEYESLYPTREEVLGIEPEDSDDDED